MAAGDVTYSAVGSNFACGKVECDADTAINVLCGFQPDKIVLHYADAGGTIDAIMTWFKGITAGTYEKIANDGTITYETSGPTVLAESDSNTTGAGFTIPAGLMDADADSIYWEAYRAQ